MIFFAPLELLMYLVLIAILGIIFIAFPIPTLIVVGLIIWAVVAFRREGKRIIEEGEKQDD